MSKKRKEMKKVIILMLSFFLPILEGFGQSFDGYKYIFIPTLIYQNNQSDIWGISKNVRSYFEKRGFSVINEISTIPDEINFNQCLKIRCDITHTSIDYGINEVSLVFTNCKNKVVYSDTAKSWGWTIQEDLNGATRKLFNKLDKIEYKFNPNVTPQYRQVEIINENEESIKKYCNEGGIDPIEGIYKSFTSDQLSWYKFGIIRQGEKFKAVVIESGLSHWRQGEVKGTFEKTSIKGLYALKWETGNKETIETFCTLTEDAILSFEEKNITTGENTKQTFIKLYPSIEKESDNSNKEGGASSSGSGFFLTNTGVIATNAHVIENGRIIKISLLQGSETINYSAKVLLIDKRNDVALLQIDDPKFKPIPQIPFKITENCEVGSKVFTIGYPLNQIMGSNFKVSDGIVNSQSGIGDDIRYYQISVPLQPGNSGGPLFNKDGNIVGITTSRLNSDVVGAKVENVNYAIKSAYLLSLYYMLPNSSKLQDYSQLGNKEFQEQIKILKNYVCLIRVFQ